MFLHPSQAGEVAKGIEAWCRGDHIQSAGLDDTNRITSDFDWLIQGFEQPFGPSNPMAAKKMSHANRWRTFYEGYMSEPDNDHAAGKLVFHALMDLSGSQKLLCATMAEDGEHFKQLMEERPISVFTRSVVTERLASAYGSERTLTQRQAQLGEHLACTHDHSLTNIRNMVERGRKLGQSVDDARAIQTNWLRTTVQIVDVLAEERGSLKTVPALEPKSIGSNPAVIYPFRDGVTV